ncbi:MAG: hypothetical protein ACRD1E_04355 [Terriglobales bacterium]
MVPAHRWGSIGVVVGTAVPMLVTTLFFLPIHTCRLVRVPLRAFLSEDYLVPALLCAPLVLALVAYRRLAPGLGYANLAGGGLGGRGRLRRSLWLVVPDPRFDRPGVAGTHVQIF